MSATAAGSIATGFQLGYAVSLLFFSSLADRVGARRVFLGSAWLSAVSALAWALWARSYVSGLVLYTLVALSQGGSYTTAIMLLADRYPAERRGAAVGWLIASSSAGYALSLLVDRKSTRLNSSHSQISYAVFCLKKKITPFMCCCRPSTRISHDLTIP